jgi:hypothetical protein
MGHAWVQVFYLQLTGTGITTADLSTLATDIATDWNTNIAPTVPSTVAMAEVSIVYVPSVGNEVVANVSVSHVGTSPNTQVDDAAACYVINWSISAYYRGGHPRWYLPGPTTNNVTNGSDIPSASQAGLATAANAFRTAINGYTTANISGVVMGTLSFATGNAWRATPLFRTFTGASTSPKLGSQRRRIHA